MKASLRFREEQKPLFKAKVPLNILGLPFQSSLSAGDSKELSLGIATFFDSGPSFRFSYHPNDAFHPFSLLIKTGIGHFGSPIEAPMTMTAEFNFPNTTSSSSSSNPRFFLHFKPRFGDFSIKKSQSSNFSSIKLNQNGAGLEEEEVDPSSDDGDFFKVGTGSKITSLPLKSSLESAVSGMELRAKTALPVRNGAVLNLRWGIKFPEGFNSLLKNPTAKVSPRGIPMLVLNKIGIEHVVKEDTTVGSSGVVLSESAADLAETCFGVKRQLETLRFENAQLVKALDDLRVDFGSKGLRREKGAIGGEREIMEVDVEGDVGGDVSKA